MRVLDLFCGLKGWSAPWLADGHDVTTLDIDPSFKPDIVADIRKWTPAGLRFDVVLASPPCEEFSRWRMRGVNRTLRHRFNTEGLPVPSVELVDRTMRIIYILQPIFWLIENVHGSGQFITPRIGHYRGNVGPFYLWGTFPPLPSDLGYRVANTMRPKENMSSSWAAERAKIPPILAEAVYHSCGPRWATQVQGRFHK